MGVDAFTCVWDPTKLHWIFVQPSMVARAVNYLKLAKARALCLVPQWKFSHFYPWLMDLCEQGKFMNFQGRMCLFRARIPQVILGLLLRLMWKFGTLTVPTVKIFISQVRVGGV